jgi:hypothetical protein
MSAPVIWLGSRKRRQQGLLFAFVPGSASVTATGTFARASTATYTELFDDTLFAYASGGDLSASTFARTGTATFNADV